MADHARHVNATGFKAILKRLRRTNRRLFNHLFTRVFGTTEPHCSALAEHTRRVLVVRLNKRLGNILFLTPMLRSLAASLPTATIDVVIQDSRHKPLLESLPGIGRVWVYERTFAASLRLARDLRARRYDLAIDPCGNSASNRIALALSGARQHMGFANSGQWLRLTHAAPRTHSRHQAMQAVELLKSSVADKTWETFDTLAVFPGDAAQRAAHAHWIKAFGIASSMAPVVAFFTEATGDKRLDDAWWADFRNEFVQKCPQAQLLQICAPDSPTPEDIASVRIAELDVLAAVLSRADVFIAADSGPMHLAAAAGVPVVGLFKTTQPAFYAPLGRDCVCLAEDDLTQVRAVESIARMLSARRTCSAA